MTWKIDFLSFHTVGSSNCLMSSSLLWFCHPLWEIRNNMLFEFLIFPVVSNSHSHLSEWVTKLDQAVRDDDIRRSYGVQDSKTNQKIMGFLLQWAIPVFVWNPPSDDTKFPKVKYFPKNKNFENKRRKISKNTWIFEVIF